MDEMLLLALVVGIVFGWLIFKLFSGRNNEGISKSELAEHYVPKTSHQQLQNEYDILREDAKEKELEIRNLSVALAQEKQQAEHLGERFVEHKQEMNRLQEYFKLEFENVANRLFEEKSKQFSTKSEDKLNHLLNPLFKQITQFEQQIERKYLDETKERASLKKELEHLRTLNQQLSEDANNLVSALKGDNKFQGNWGEFQLEALLQKAGLNENFHYKKQVHLKNDEGKSYRPDFIIYLPDDKHLVVDSKVSLKAYDAYWNAQSEALKKEALAAHCKSIKNHIQELSRKSYDQLYGIHSPDYVLMYLPIEPALSIALQEDNSLFNYALDNNIVLVTNTTLLVSMRTVSYIWTQEKQKESVLEIAKQSGLLYDKFCGFVDDLQQVSKKLDDAQEAHHAAMNKLSDSKKYGDTLLGRAEKIKKLGARTNKQLPKL